MLQGPARCAEEVIIEQLDEELQVETFIPECGVQGLVAIAPALPCSLLQIFPPVRLLMLPGEIFDASVNDTRIVVLVAGRM